MAAILVYLAVVNLTAFVLLGQDKRRAAERARRIPERTLLALAAIGGSLGALAGQQAFRHKTRKQPFAGLLYGILGAQAVLALVIVIAQPSW